MRFIFLLFNSRIAFFLYLNQTIDIDIGLSLFWELWEKLLVSFLKGNLVRKCPALRFKTLVVSAVYEMFNSMGSVT